MEPLRPGRDLPCLLKPGSSTLRRPGDRATDADTKGSWCAHGRRPATRAPGRSRESLTTSLTLRHQHLSGTSLIAVGGEIDLADSGRLARYVNRVRRPGDHVVFDLTEVSFLDCSGLRVLISSARRAARRRRGRTPGRGPRRLILTHRPRGGDHAHSSDSPVPGAPIPAALDRPRRLPGRGPRPVLPDHVGRPSRST
ncbi:STAS domain-containing protein [Nonomuraea sp. H19]|uniref:STAS domain-containing protein n=1 Tax=Nonomuraea sp. H19 TaxID=3452206 RepID=UPI003F888B49